MTIDPCGSEFVAEPPLLDTVDGREHERCPELEEQQARCRATWAATTG